MNDIAQINIIQNLPAPFVACHAKKAVLHATMYKVSHLFYAIHECSLGWQISEKKNNSCSKWRQKKKMKKSIRYFTMTPHQMNQLWVSVMFLQASPQNCLI